MSVFKVRARYSSRAGRDLVVGNKQSVTPKIELEIYRDLSAIILPAEFTRAVYTTKILLFKY